MALRTPVLTHEWNSIYAMLQQTFESDFRVVLVVDPTVRTEPRHYAAVTMGGNPTLLYVHPDLYDAPVSLIRGVLAHECGHILDAQLTPASVRRLCHDNGVAYSSSEERRADALAEIALGWHIYYSREDLVQRAGPGARGLVQRPQELG
jgi:hypothetical protein